LKNNLSLLVVAVGIVSLATVARADLMTDNGVGLNEVVRLHAPGLLADNLSVYAGENLIHFGNMDFPAYCVDLNQFSGTGEVTVGSTADLPHGNYIAYLLESYAPYVATNHDAAVLAVSIWEVLAEPTTDFDVSTGYFTISDNPAVLADANTVLAGIPRDFQPTVWPSVLHSDSLQDMAFLSYGVPEPVTIGLLGLGGAAMLWRGRRGGRVG
jgi:hypothetical protein